MITALVLASSDFDQHLNKRVNVFGTVVRAETHSHHAGSRGFVHIEKAILAAPLFGFRQPEQMRDVGLRAETTTAYSDPSLEAKDGGDKGVMSRVEVEGHNTDSIVASSRIRLAVDGNPGHSPQSFE